MTDVKNTADTDVAQANQQQGTQRLTGEQVIRVLHPAFDNQIINYGAYNLVYATGSATYRNPDIAALQEDHQECFLVGLSGFTG